MNINSLALTIWTFFSASATFASANHNPKTRGKPIVIDTDVFSDVDDIGSLAIANVLHNYGLADLRGVLVNTNSKYGALAVSVINTYFGNGGIPIAALRPLTNETFYDTWNFSQGEYAAKIAHNYPRTLNDSSTTPTPTNLYRSILSSASDDNSITIISLGFLTNLAALLQTSPDNKLLISKKVKELVIMGGQYPSGWEFNFGGADITAVQYVITNWPSNIPITYSGFELGKGIFSSKELAQYAPADSPVLAAYQWYGVRCNTARESWDPVTTLYGILGFEGSNELGIGRLFEYGNEGGFNEVLGNGSNRWNYDDSKIRNQHWLKLAEGVTNTSVAQLIDRFLVHDPKEKRCSTFKSRGASWGVRNDL